MGIALTAFNGLSGQFLQVDKISAEFVAAQNTKPPATDQKGKDPMLGSSVNEKKALPPANAISNQAAKLIEFNPIGKLKGDLGSIPEQDLNLALDMIIAIQPETSNFFNWKGDEKEKDKFKNTSFFLYGVNSEDLPDEVLKRCPSPIDEFVIAGSYPKTKKTMMEIYLLADRLYRDDAGKPRPDGFVRLLAALGHAIYGDIQDFAETISKNNIIPARVDDNRHQLRSFQGGVAFLERVIKSPQFTQLPELLQDQIKGALAREKSFLKIYEGYQKK